MNTRFRAASILFTCGLIAVLVALRMTHIAAPARAGVAPAPVPVAQTATEENAVESAPETSDEGTGSALRTAALFWFVPMVATQGQGSPASEPFSD